MFEFQPNLLQLDTLRLILDDNIEKVASFTGHRPESFEDYDEESDTIIGVKHKLYNQIKNAISQGYAYFVGGGARGVDIWVGETVTELKKIYPHIKLVTIIPHENQAKSWSQSWQNRYDNLMQNSDFVSVISAGFSYASFHIRNRFLVDHSSLLIGVYNGTKGGTQSTIEYAQKQQKQIIIIDC
ncbi:MAG: DUF1273 family protein [Oscillospiraceae bacterium]|nr:DUF1273 family protein [Oscillospiraceae bacterium]